MKAAQLTHYGVDGLEIKNDVQKPSLKADQVLIEVRAASVNPFDWKVRDGQMKEFIPLNLPATLGGDVSGVVAEIGENAAGFSIGQEVFGSAGAVSGEGSLAEYCPVVVDQLAPLPKGTDFVSAAALPLVSTSAYQALIEYMDIQAGQKVLIHGAAGGIGSMAVQIAKHHGAYVAGTASTNDIEFVKELGADKVINYATQDFAELVKDYDAVFDMVGGETNTKSYAVLKPGGILVSMVAEQNEALVERHQIRYLHQSSRATTERLRAVSQLVESGNLKIYIDKVFPFDKTPEAFDHLKNNHPRGKVVVQISA